MSSLNPSDLSVESFEIAAPVAYPTRPGGMKTFEPGCTTPDLCPMDVAAPAPGGAL